MIICEITLYTKIFVEIKIHYVCDRSFIKWIEMTAPESKTVRTLKGTDSR